MFMIPFKRESALQAHRDTLRALDHDFSEVLQVLNGGGVAPGAFIPSLDVKESKDAYTILADLPGVDKKDIQVQLEEGLLTVSGTRKAEHQESSEDRTWHRVERGWGSFERSLRLGDAVDGDNVSAEYKDGVLSVTVPKKASAQPRQVEVK